MPLFPSLRRQPDGVEAKSGEGIVWSTVDGQIPRWLGGRRRKYAQDVEHAIYGAYEKTVWLWRGASFMAGHASRLPFRYQVPDTDTFVDDHAIVRLLRPHSKVNPIERGRAFKRRLFLQVMFSPRGAFVELTYSRGGDIIRLDLLHPGRTRAVPGDGNNLISHFETQMPGNAGIRPIPVENVWWIRQPHPLDPYGSDTMMSAIGASVEMDDLGRSININWMLNDGQLRAIVGVKGALAPEEKDKIEKRFGRGPVDAGRVTVVNSDQVSFADVSGRPKDMQYEQLSRNAREEVLGALGVAESLLGISKGSTFDNAAQDKYNFWTEAMPPLLEPVAAELVDPRDKRDLVPLFDLTGVEALQLPQLRRREEARLEFAAGLRSVESYSEMAEIEVYSTPETRGLWIPNTGKQLIGQTSADVAEQEKRREEMAAVAQAGPAPTENGPGGNGDGDQDGNGGGATGGRQQPRAAGGGASGGRTPAPAGGGRAAQAARQSGNAQAAKTAPVDLAVRLGVPRYELKAADSRTVDMEDAQLGTAEEAAVAALTALVTRWAARTEARLRSPRARKGTRHWQPGADFATDTRVGMKALDTEAAVDAGSWEQEATAAVGAVLAAAATGAAATTAAGLAGTGAGATATAPVAATAEAVAVAASITTLVGQAARTAGQRLAAALAAGEAAGDNMDALVKRVNVSSLVEWAQRTARHAAMTAVSGGMYAAGRVAAALGATVTAEWKSRRDPRVRRTHSRTDGQTRAVGTPFKVGDGFLLYPRDPAGSLEETIGCRCKLRLHVKVGRVAVAV